MQWPITPAQVPQHRKAQDEGTLIPSSVLIVVENHPGTTIKLPNRTEDYPLEYPSSALRSQVCVHRFLDASIFFKSFA
jgi:hypothetical protein